MLFTSHDINQIEFFKFQFRHTVTSQTLEFISDQLHLQIQQSMARVKRGEDGSKKI